jgi:multisubunit Na+/H+ antiporter MnhB subunit
MKFDFGLAITAVAMLLFYVRLAMLRGKKRRLEREQALKAKKAGKGAKVSLPDPNKPRYEIRSWVMVGVAVLLMLVGLAARQTASFPQVMQDYWWVGTSLGAVLFSFCFK